MYDEQQPENQPDVDAPADLPETSAVITSDDALAEDTAPAAAEADASTDTPAPTDTPADAEVELPGDADLVDVVDEAPRPKPKSPYDRPGRWYVVHTYAGYENKVKQNLASRVRSMAVEENDLRGRHPDGRRHRVQERP